MHPGNPYHPQAQSSYGANFGTGEMYNNNGGGGGAAPTTTPWFANPTATPANLGNFASPPLSGQGNSVSTSLGGEEDYDNEPPLLEELGINFEHIWNKTKLVLIPTGPINEHILDDTDLAGPLVFCFLLGMCLLLAAKVHFGYIYGFGATGCGFMYCLMNLLSPARTIDIYRVISVLGYGILPIIGLAALNIVISVKNLGILGFIIAAICTIWSTHTATRFFEKALHMAEQKYLIAYPVGLVYTCFVLITVF